MAITVDDVADIGNSTIATFDKNVLTDIATTEEEHFFLPSLIDNERVTYDGGHKYIWDILYQDIGGARNIGYHDKDQISDRDVVAQAEMEWCRTISPWMVDILAIQQNRNDANKIVDIFKTKRAAAFLSMSNQVEADGWSKPASDDGVTPMGIMYWIVKSITGTSAATAAGGFNGGNPSGFSSGCANVSSTTHTGWANWAHAYVDVTYDDLVRKMRLAAHRTNFKSPMKGKIKENKRGADRYVWYMPYTVLAELEDRARDQHDQVGKDIAAFDGRTVFHRNPLVAVSKLDDDSDNPVYGINWGVFSLVVMRGSELSETPVKPIPGMSENVWSKWRLVWNTKCTNRRRLVVLSTAADNAS